MRAQPAPIRTRRLLVGAVVATGLLLSTLSTSASGSTSPRPQTVVEAPSHNVGPILFLGDSVGASIQWSLSKKLSAGGYDVVYDAKSGRCTIKTPGRCRKGDVWEALDQLDPSFRPKIAVVELGYNDTKKSLALGIDTLMKDLLDRGVKKVLWINLSERRPDGAGGSFYAPYNDVMRAAAKKWKALTILDWEKASDASDDTGWFVPFSKGKVDLIHLRTSGQKAFAQFIRDELDRLRDAGKLPDAEGNFPDSVDTSEVDQDTPARERPVLRNGDSGAWVAVMQQLLLENGVKTIADGEFGKGTERAVKRFQRANGLKADGVVGPKTWGRLMG